MSAISTTVLRGSVAHGSAPSNSSGYAPTTRNAVRIPQFTNDPDEPISTLMQSPAYDSEASLLARIRKVEHVVAAFESLTSSKRDHSSTSNAPYDYLTKCWNST
ncbi:hypothetical protein G7Z17_g200 [Cylindrodendrum hubeiense]|uniref:Uncharacterized protein n=1 Tax=Cylindrodendrum hubeiense TaxID=595255 RepID=A0A9P5HHK0_9HYPO|nr:hypothetical protein G7Z17_g200 [Cylindrodendrum hubeiense]